MKVEKSAPKFEPIIITLETQEEVDQMFALANFMSFEGCDNITFQLFEELEGYANLDKYVLDEGAHLFKEL